VRQKALEAGAFNAVVSSHWAHGGAGALQLAEAIVAASKKPSNFKFLYSLDVRTVPPSTPLHVSFTLQIVCVN